MTRPELEAFSVYGLDRHILELQERARRLRAEVADVSHELRLAVHVLEKKLRRPV